MVNEKGEQVGIVTNAEAQAAAEAVGMDLVMMAENDPRRRQLLLEQWQETRQQMELQLHGELPQLLRRMHMLLASNINSSTIFIFNINNTSNSCSINIRDVL